MSDLYAIQNGKLGPIVAKDVTSTIRVVYNWDNLLEDDKFGAKHRRLVENLLNKQDYIFLCDTTDPVWQAANNAKIRIGADVAPLRLILSIFGYDITEFYNQPFAKDYFGYEPRITIPTGTTIYESGDSLLSELVSCMAMSNQSHPDHKGFATFSEDPHRLRITTRYILDSTGFLSQGGDFYQYRIFEIRNKWVFSYTHSGDFQYSSDAKPNLYMIDVWNNLEPLHATASIIARDLVLFDKKEHVCMHCGHKYVHGGKKSVHLT